VLLGEIGETSICIDLSQAMGHKYFVYARHHGAPRFEWGMFGCYTTKWFLLKDFFIAQREYGDSNVIVSCKDEGYVKICSVFKGVELLEIAGYYLDVFRFEMNFTL